MADLRVEMEEAKADSLSRVSSDAMMANVVGLLETAQVCAVAACVGGVRPTPMARSHRRR